MKIDLNTLITESRNPASQAIDTLSTVDMLKVINDEDKQVALAVERTLPQVAQAVDAIAIAFQQGGRLIYSGAGTSGRLGILDASECPPTYGSDPSQVIGLIAGGREAIFRAVENAEDNTDLGAEDLKALNFSDKDVLVGIAASGRTPYVIGAMTYAKSIGATVASISCNPNSAMTQLADIAMTPIVGPEVVTGSSRMKAGTAQKMILNMLTTGAMIRTGKVYGNLMVDVEATNAKLVERQKNIVTAATGATREQAESALTACGGHCKTAIVMILTGSTAEEARVLLNNSQGFTRQAVQQVGQ
ncbi:N-acetylmuramic acid 6-phosphate etherase [Photobacterium sp. WH77]|uniref:N-acetylmuramic acid 6-phosphate etherase n=1 Tax=unclassified Photobacterium TaxID=2628852 RepID=UPI001EDBF139|nr:MULTISPECIES: N-acetylmuramic acid 6-phosphate etherase [unclassified Photobacterium]MCG2837658.1 N-acetylmuramic acid 6-phosphate etherase [Photobacterium sp. WH77]MCG2845274.1 N-acetylmuramic acid 6-phosphate etherase [Photobacterium sp. WH80]